MVSLAMPNAHIVCWSLDETRVLIVPRKQFGDLRQVWCRVDFDPVLKRYYCVWTDKAFHLCFA